MASDAVMSPGFSDWNSVFVKYCDGSSFTGHSATAINVNGSLIHYSGAIMCVMHVWLTPAFCTIVHSLCILSSVVLDLARFGINLATDVVVAGCSAGGLAVLLNIDRIRQLLPASARVRGLSDAGFFIHAVNRHGAESLCGAFFTCCFLPADRCSNRTARLRWGFHAWNSSAALNPSCLASHTQAPWMCMLPPAAALFIRTPVFIVNSAVDSCQAIALRNLSPCLLCRDVQDVARLCGCMCVICNAGQRLQPPSRFVRCRGLAWAFKRRSSCCYGLRICFSKAASANYGV